MLGLRKSSVGSDTILVEWFDLYSSPIIESFTRKTRAFVLRISWYLDAILDQYFPIVKEKMSPQENKIITGTELQILHNIIGALSCLAQGLFMQNGILIRSAIENCLVLVDLIENKQAGKIISGKYSVNNLISRVKNAIPSLIIDWYGHFSANFTHFGPLHPAVYLPKACFAENLVLVHGLQSIVRAIVTFHIVLERVYFNEASVHLFWAKAPENADLIFNSESIVFN
jgi:hypothetical protein